MLNLLQLCEIDEKQYNMGPLSLKMIKMHTDSTESMFLHPNFSPAEKIIWHVSHLVPIYQ